MSKEDLFLKHDQFNKMYNLFHFHNKLNNKYDILKKKFFFILLY